MAATDAQKPPTRSTCDKCRYLKQACQRDLGSVDCKRCLRLQIQCTYSAPLRMGRPRKNESGRAHSASLVASSSRAESTHRARRAAMPDRYGTNYERSSAVSEDRQTALDVSRPPMHPAFQEGPMMAFSSPSERTLLSGFPTSSGSAYYDLKTQNLAFGHHPPNSQTLSVVRLIKAVLGLNINPAEPFLSLAASGFGNDDMDMFHLPSSKGSAPPGSAFPGLETMMTEPTVPACVHPASSSNVCMTDSADNDINEPFPPTCALSDERHGQALHQLSILQIDLYQSLAKLHDPRPDAAPATAGPPQSPSLPHQPRPRGAVTRYDEVFGATHTLVDLLCCLAPSLSPAGAPLDIATALQVLSCYLRLLDVYAGLLSASQRLLLLHERSDRSHSSGINSGGGRDGGRGKRIASADPSCTSSSPFSSSSASLPSSFTPATASTGSSTASTSRRTSPWSSSLAAPSAANGEHHCPPPTWTSDPYTRQQHEDDDRPQPQQHREQEQEEEVPFPMFSIGSFRVSGPNDLNTAVQLYVVAQMLRRVRRAVRRCVMGYDRQEADRGEAAEEEWGKMATAVEATLGAVREKEEGLGALLERMGRGVEA
ncbi:uncharacterized protein PFLUO_LOCUS767 [Penicillium psychrofluorescens]|uniref:uncharacterized protein n=1 Tax=Penicillium psychrofluorescens TaxID=3158075 RepID=UPI003CCD74AD